MRHIPVLAAILLVLTIISGCSANGNALPVPSAMVGSWYDSNSGSTVIANEDNIILHISDVSTVPSYNFRSMIESAPQAYNVSGNESSLSIRLAGMYDSGYFFTMDGDTLKLRITVGTSITLTFERQ